MNNPLNLIDLPEDKDVAHRIMIGQHIWIGAHEPQERNGTIVDVDWEEQDLVASFSNNRYETFDFWDLKDKWNEQLGGYWHVD